MLALASILSAFAAIVCLYFRAPERAKAGRFPHSAAERKVLGVAAIGGLAASLVLAVVALGRAAGIGLWLVALMATGVAVVSIAGNHPVTARWLGYAMRLPEAGSGSNSWTPSESPRPARRSTGTPRRNAACGRSAAAQAKW